MLIVTLGPVLAVVLAAVIVVTVICYKNGACKKNKKEPQLNNATYSFANLRDDPSFLRNNMSNLTVASAASQVWYEDEKTNQIYAGQAKQVDIDGQQWDNAAKMGSPSQDTS